MHLARHQADGHRRPHPSARRGRAHDRGRVQTGGGATSSEGGSTAEARLAGNQELEQVPRDRDRLIPSRPDRTTRGVAPNPFTTAAPVTPPAPSPRIEVTRLPSACDGFTIA